MSNSLTSASAGPGTLAGATQRLQCYLETGDLARASDVVADMERLWPGRATTQSARGALAFRLKEYPAAVAAFRRAVAVQEATGQSPTADTLHNLASALDDLGDKQEAQTHYLAALQRQPTHLAALTQLAALLRGAGRFDEAKALLHTALAAHPGHGYTCYSMGSTLYEQGQREQALVWLDRAIGLDPALAEAHFHKALCCLQMGDFATGWEHWEWRWKIPQAKGSWPPFKGPVWQGEPLALKILLVWGEQGLGDNVQFVRYLAQVRQRWPQAGLVYWCPQTLMPLVAEFARQHKVALLPREQALPHNVQGHDCHLPLMSLPRLLGVRLENPDHWHGPAAYLQVPTQKIAAWGARLQAVCPRRAGRLRVGLVWSGAKAFIRAERRNITLPALAPWLQLPGIDWVSLQVGEARDEMAGTLWAARLVDLTPEIVDFADTAALAEHLDVVISVDTGTAHVAAATGRPVWLLSRFDGCWRWLLDRNDNPWYPSMRVFRQPRPLNWTPVVQEVAQALSQMTQPGNMQKKLLTTDNPNNPNNPNETEKTNA
jgi:tetratricopeptide (TPR) repeat protein